MEDFLLRHNIKNTTVAVAVSGGADSLALVLMANEQYAVDGVKIVALTVDHRLRSTSAQEAEYVANLMKAHGIEHHILVWEGDKPQTGIEETAREARYELMREWCLRHDIHYLMVAHHLFDQAETFLMRLQRGSGLKGLCCMREVVSWRGLNILRPLLHTKPQVMKDYLTERHILWVEDESNHDETFLRNKLRRYLPEFSRQTGIDVEKIDNAVQCLQSAESYIAEQVETLVNKYIQTERGGVCSFKHSDYLQWHHEMKFRIIAELCKRDYIPRSDRVLSVIDKLNHLPFSGQTLGDREIFIAYGRVWIVPQLLAKHKSTRTEWKEFILQNPEYKNRKIPHKARLAILQSKGK
ncbi:MAG: tRNA lysidine(34) synthetase TilS [Alphaproteobacteria bacterium]